MLNDECITKKAREALRWFTTEDTDRGSIVILKEGRPEWVADVVYNCHDGQQLNDWINKTVKKSLHRIINYNGVEVARWMEPDVYNHDLTEWARVFPEYVDDALQEGLFDSYFGLLQYAQASHKQEIFTTVLDALKVACDGGDDDNDD